MKFLPGPTPSCTLITVDIDKAPPYMALSYTWGSRALDGNFVIDGKSVAITQNLEEALKKLHPYLKKEALLLWADLICINQADVLERSHQIRLMNAIYRCAERVGVWLGEARDDSDLVLDKLRKWTNEFTRLTEVCEGDFDQAMHSISPPNQVFYDFNGKVNPLIWQALRALFQRDWWQRAWVVQEATALAPSRTYLFCGDFCVDWYHFRTAIWFYNRVGYYDSEPTDMSFEVTMATRLDAFRITRESGAYMRLLSILECIRSFNCEDPRDKVYTGLGMAADVLDSDIVPDYRKSLEEVFIDVVEFILSHSSLHSLDFLGAVIRPYNAPFIWADDLPSWVPDWRVQVTSYALKKYLNPEEFGSERVYSASAHLQKPVWIDGRRLHCEGFVLDTVVRVWSPCWSNLVESEIQTERSWMPEENERPYVLGGTVLEAFNRTLVADIGRNDMTIDELQRGFAVDWNLLNTKTSDLSLLDKKRRMWMLIDIKRTTFGRRLFETKAGLIGLGAAATDVGDSVCVLFGGQVLYLLRTKSNSNDFEFIGECYVHGMMDGEAVKDLDLPSQEFVIV